MPVLRNLIRKRQTNYFGVSTVTNAHLCRHLPAPVMTVAARNPPDARSLESILPASFLTARSR